MTGAFAELMASGRDWSHWIALFWSKVDRVTDPGGCWPWLRAKDKDGYGKFQVSLPGQNRQLYFRAHRFSLFLATGLFEELVEHNCHHEVCVRPDHHIWGTQASNITSTVIRGTHRTASFSEEQVRHIRRRHAGGERIAEIARSAGRRFTTISAIVHRRTWRHLDGGDKP